MFTQKILSLLTALFMFFVLTATAHATLLPRGGGLVYDDVLDITWLQNANFANATGYDDFLYGSDTNGQMTWADAVDWAAGLSYYDSVRDVTYDDWRLPTTPGTATGYVNEGEMGYLYHDEGVTSSTPSYFIDVQPFAYWSETGHAVVPEGAWMFHFDLGAQNATYKTTSYYAWAVRDGNVTAVPEPGTLFLLGTGLSGLFVLRKRV